MLYLALSGVGVWLAPEEQTSDANADHPAAELRRDSNPSGHRADANMPDGGKSKTEGERTLDDYFGSFAPD